ncbi:MAG: anti-sigma factor antagonist BldG [Solirubrobacteraceae bacterium]
MTEQEQRVAFSIVGEQEGSTQIVVVCGEIDLANAEEVDSALLTAERAGNAGVLLDLTAVNFIDSTGLRVLLGSIRRLSGESRSLTVACPDGPVRRLFELTALTGQFALFESRAAALASLA